MLEGVTILIGHHGIVTRRQLLIETNCQILHLAWN